MARAAREINASGLLPTCWTWQDALNFWRAEARILCFGPGKWRDRACRLYRLREFPAVREAVT